MKNRNINSEYTTRNIKPEIGVQEYKPGLQNLEYKHRNINPGIRNQSIVPGVENQEYKAMNTEPGITMKEKEAKVIKLKL